MSERGDKDAEKRLDELFAGYGRALVSYLDQLSDDVARRPDAALWNARRCTEALCGAILVRKEGRDPWSGDADLSNLLKRLYKLYPEFERTLQWAHRHGNEGAHVRIWQPTSPPWEQAWLVAGFVAEATQTFVEKAGPELRLEATLAKRLRREARELLELKEALGREGARDRKVIHSNSLEAELATERSARTEREAEVARLRAERNAARETIKRLESEARQRTEAEVTASRSEGAHLVPTEQARPGSARRAIIGAFVLGGLLGLMAALVPRAWPPGGTTDSTPPQPAAATPSTGNASTGDASTSKPAPAPSPSTSTPSSAASAMPAPPPPLTCPTDMLLVGGSTFSLRQPHPRPTWPAPAADPVEISLDSFCIHAQPVFASEYDRCVKDGVCRAVKTPNRGAIPMNLVTHDEAFTYCTSIGASLPRLAEWELARRTLVAKLVLAPQTGEWVLDAFPSPDLRRGPAGGDFTWFDRSLDLTGIEPRFSWNQGSKALGNLGFRCVKH